VNQDATAEPVDLAGAAGEGPVWGMASEDLNATLLNWRAGEGVVEHANADLDVLLVVVAGSGVVSIDGHERVIRSGHAVLLAKGTRRAIRGGPEGLRYLSIHRNAPACRSSGPSVQRERTGGRAAAVRVCHLVWATRCRCW
jgi:mannose-6-phosphate isomerase-like protein (cupin superfamily)